MISKPALPVSLADSLGTIFRRMLFYLRAPSTGLFCQAIGHGPLASLPFLGVQYPSAIRHSPLPRVRRAACIPKGDGPDRLFNSGHLRCARRSLVCKCYVHASRAGRLDLRCIRWPGHTSQFSAPTTAWARIYLPVILKGQGNVPGLRRMEKRLPRRSRRHPGDAQRRQPGTSPGA